MPALSEERVGLATPPYRDSFFLVDPLDGTKEFVAGRNEFTVNHRAGDRGNAAARHRRARRRSGVIWRGIVGRGAERLTLRDGASRARRADPHPALAAARKALDGGGQPLAWRCQDGGLYCRSPRRGQRPCSARRSNSAGSPKAKPISIPASPRPANGTSRPATP